MDLTINRRMLVYKLFYLFSLAAMSIIPFFSIYFKQVGMSPVQIGVLSAARPIFLALSAPVIGYFTDKYQAPKVTVVVGGGLWIASTAVMGFTVMPFIEEKACDEIHNELYQRRFQCTSANVSGFSKHGRGNFGNMLTDDIEAHEAIDKQSLDNHNDSELCHSIDSALDADRSWLYTPESLEIAFYILLICNSLFDMSFNPLHSIADAEAVNTLQDMGIDIADYGKQRAFGSLGWTIGPLIFGPWIAFTRQDVLECGVVLNKADYTPMFIVFLMMAGGAMLTTLWFSYEYKQDSHGSYRLDSRVIRELCKLPNLAVLFVVFFIGVCNGTLHGYLFWYLDNIGGDELIMGLASAVHGISEFILGLSTGVAIRKFGHFPLISLGILSYLVRFVYYAYVKQPWWILGSEVLHSLTFLLTWNTSMSYLSIVVPEDYRISLASLLNSLYHGFGNGFGYVISGYLIQEFGSVATFKIFAVVNAVTAILVTTIFMVFSYSTKYSDDVEQEKKRLLMPSDSPEPFQYTLVHQQPSGEQPHLID